MAFKKFLKPKYFIKYKFKQIKTTPKTVIPIQNAVIAKLLAKPYSEGNKKLERARRKRTLKKALLKQKVALKRKGRKVKWSSKQK